MGKATLGIVGKKKSNKTTKNDRVCRGCAGRFGETQEVKNKAYSEVKVTQTWSLLLQHY